MRFGAPLADEIKSQLLGSLRTVPKTVLERERQTVDLIVAVRRFSGRFKITWFPREGRSGLRVIWPDLNIYRLETRSRLERRLQSVPRILSLGYNSLRRSVPAKPRIPVPSMISVPGSGVVEVV